MAKDKPMKRVNLNSLIAEERVESKPVRQEDQINVEFYNDELNQKLIDYNERVTELDEKYSSLKFRRDILIRVFVNPMQKSENGVLIPNKAQIKVPTQHGLGNLGFVDNPYPYANKGVIVSLPSNITDLKVGDIVAFGNNPVNANLVGKDTAIVQVPSAFIHPDERHKYVEHIVGIPEDPTDPNYGYLAVQDYEIQIVL